MHNSRVILPFEAISKRTHIRDANNFDKSRNSIYFNDARIITLITLYLKGYNVFNQRFFSQTHNKHRSTCDILHERNAQKPKHFTAP